MDIGKFFGGIADFFTGNQRKKEEEQRRQQQAAAQQRPTLPVTTAKPQQTLTVRTPEPLVPGSTLQLGGTKPQAQVQAPVRQPAQAGLLEVRGAAPSQPEKKEPNLLERLGAGVQQAAGQFGDFLAQGGLVTGAIADKLNPFLNDEQRNARLQEQTKITQNIRNTIQNQKDITGENIVGTSNADEAAGRIARGQGTVQDFATVGGTGLDVANTATMFINPLRVASGVAESAGRNTVREILPFVAKEAGLYGASGAAAAGTQAYGATGDLGEATRQALIGGAASAVPQLGLEGLALGTRRLIRGTEGNAPRLSRSAEATEQIVEGGAESQKPTVEVPAGQATPREPSSPITSAAQAERPAGITSPAQQAATAVQPQPFQFGGNRDITAQPSAAPQAPTVTPIPQILGQIDDAAAAQRAQVQRALDEQALAPRPEQAPAQATVVEPDNVAQSRMVAEESMPVSPEAVQQQIAQEVSRQAPTFSVPEQVRNVDEISAPVRQPEELGDIARSAVVDGTINAGDIQNRIADAAQAAAENAGSSWEAINKKVQNAFSKRLSWQEAGLTPQEAEVFQRYSNELNTLRGRVDPSLLGQGEVSPFYSPRQAEGTEYDPSLVNERSRDRKNGLSDADLDLSIEPTRQYVQRYADAPTAMADNLINEIENTVKANGDVIPTGVKVGDDIRAKLKDGIEKYVNLKDEYVRAADAGDADSLDKLLSDADKQLDDVLADLAGDVSKLPGNSRQAINNLIDTRKAYIQSTVRTNMFLNLANRVYDQAQKGIIQGSDRLLLNLANKVTGGKIGGTVLATDRVSNKLAKKYSSGTLMQNIGRDLRTSTRLATAGTEGFDKAIRWLDGAYRAAGTALTSFGDLTTSAAKVANLRILQEAQEKGIKGATELENYLVRERSTPRYQELLRDTQNQYMGYTGIPQTVTAVNKGDNKFVKVLATVDNAINKSLDNAPLPDRVKRELNDIVMPATSGFAAATARIAGKQLNALALGIPGFKKGAELALSDAPNAKAIGQLMMSRSLIDGVLGGGTMVGGLILGSSGQWTGSYPSDPNERARWEKDGIQENSIPVNVGDKTLYIQPGRILGVLALPLVLPTVVGNAIREGNDVGDAMGQVVDGTLGQFIDNFGVDALASHISDVYQAIQGTDNEKEQARKSLMNMLGFSIANAVTPAAGLQNNIANATDPYKRDTSGGLTDYVKSRNPFTRQTLDVKTDNLGNPIENNTQISGGSAAITLGSGTSEEQTQGDPLNSEINRLASLKLETVPGKDVENTNSQEDAKLLLNSTLYKNADDKTKADLLKETLLGTKTKDISTSLPAEQRSALIDYKLQSEDKRKVWLDNNENAANYYQADYDNAKANGTLTQDDDNLQNKSGKKYQAVRAKVNQETNTDRATQLLYDDTSVEEWRDMIDPDSPDYDPETAQKLFAYDAARTKAGVSGKSSDSAKAKFTEKSSRGGRGGKSDNFAFASMPSSLVGTGTTSKYDNGERLFKPIPDLQAPTKANIPKSRTISVKRGVTV